MIAYRGKGRSDSWLRFKAAQDDQSPKPGKPLSGYEDDSRDTPPNDRPFLLFQRNGSSIQHRDMEQAAMELLQEAAANKRAGLGLVGEDRADDAFANGGDGGDRNEGNDERSDDPGSGAEGSGLPWWLAMQSQAGGFGSRAATWDVADYLLQVAANGQALAPRADVPTDKAKSTGDERFQDSSSPPIVTYEKPKPRRFKDEEDLKAYIFKHYGDSAWKASAKYPNAPFHVLLGLTEQEKTGSDIWITPKGGNGPTQIQRDGWLADALNDNRITQKQHDAQAATVKGGNAPFTDPVLEEMYRKEVSDPDTAFELTARILSLHMKNPKNDTG